MPFGFNCHAPTDQSPNLPSESQGSARADDVDQTVRALEPVEDDGAPAGEAKVRFAADALGFQSKLSSTSDSMVPRGTKLLALFDNECRARNGRASESSSGSSAALKFEAEEFSPKDNQTLASMTAEAEADPCLVRLDENRRLQLVDPNFDPSAATAGPGFSSLAVTNDARASEARHVIFSKALLAWDWFYSGVGLNSDVVVAIIDSGVLHTHPDLAQNMWMDTDGSRGYDFVNRDTNPTDDNGHGTHCAGIVGARADNGVGVLGIAGNRVKIMGVKVLDNTGSGTEAQIVNGIRFATDRGAHVINLSLGGQFQSPALRDAMIYATTRGVVVIVAAGNDNVLIDDADLFYAPSGYSKEIPGALSVGSVDAGSGARSVFSNYGTNYVWIAAPGSGGILSTYAGNGYTSLQGTSMAAPVVAGAAALLVGSFRSKSITYTPEQIVSLLTESARPVTALNTFFRSGATLDIERAAKLFYSRYVLSGDGGTEGL